jgi:hypothetical protein
MLHRLVDLILDARIVWSRKLAKVAECGGRLVADAFFGESGEAFAEDVVNVRDGGELTGKGSELRGELVGLERLLLFACAMDAEGRMGLLAKHATGAAIGGLTNTLVTIGIERI